MPLNDGGGLDQHHRFQAGRPYSVEPNPEQPIDREEAGSTGPLAAKNLQLMPEGEVI